MGHSCRFAPSVLQLEQTTSCHVVSCRVMSCHVSQPPQTSLLSPDNQQSTTQTQCFQQYSVTMETPPMAWMGEFNGN